MKRTILNDLIENPTATGLLVSNGASSLMPDKISATMRRIPPTKLVENLKTGNRLDFLVIDLDIFPGVITQEMSNLLSGVMKQYGCIVLIKNGRKKHYFAPLRIAHSLRANQELEFLTIDEWKNGTLFVFRRVDKRKFSSAVALDKPLRYVIADKIYFSLFGNARVKRLAKSMVFFFLKLFNKKNK